MMAQPRLAGTAAPLLLVTDQLPYPPRNGITLPVYNYAIRLRQSRPLTIVLLADAAAPVDPAALADNARLFGTIEVVYVTRRARAWRLAAELCGREMYQHGWQRAPRSASAPDRAADTVIVSPMSAVAKWRGCGLQARTTCRVAIAAVNDCTTAEYYFRGAQHFGGLKAGLKGWLDRRRSRQIGSIEARLLANYDHILLQTATDQALMQRLVSPRTAARVTTVPNGVRADYFALAPATATNQVAFVAELSGEYAATADWLIGEVWPAVRRRHPDGQLLMVGKGAAPALKDAIARTAGITHIEFVPDLCQLYGQATIALSPVFKGFGLINKTLEAMAAGVPVVGGVAAFNGIAGFADQVHGMACATRASAAFADAIVALLRAPARRQAIGSAGRALVQRQFCWDEAAQKVDALIGAGAAAIEATP
jgi:glycosyltransferase involved in cell wall biosynthesis